MRGGSRSQFALPTSVLSHGALRDPAMLALWFTERPADRWAAYVIGVAHRCLVPCHGRDEKEVGGFRLLIESDVPEGKGVSSSAALEVACLSVIAARYGVEMSGDEIALACQWAENHIAGAPCGIMDQMTSVLGRRDRLLRLQCQPAIVEGHVDIPRGFRFYGIDSGIRHAVTGSDYATVRTAAFMGYRIIADIVGLAVVADGPVVRVEDPMWRGYLTNINSLEFESRFVPQLPERMTGAEFLARYWGTTDRVTRVEPERTYPVRQATIHPVREHWRVTSFARLLEALGDADPKDVGDSGPLGYAAEMGHLMYQSHESYGACGLGSEGTDRLVAMVRQAGVARGLFGAKITGGGSGGTVALLGTEDAEPVVREIARAYECETGLPAEVFARSGRGAEEVGVLLA
jgi:L-arabinokinase